MKVLHNESLKEYTTIRIGGIAKNFYIPESRNELISLLKILKDKKYYILGGGSNLLINDKKVFENVISVKSFDKSIKSLGYGIYYVGASVRIQKLIDTINSHGYGGIEYLYSVPGLVGGAIAMNAGRGKKYKSSISDYIIDVHAYIDGDIKILNKEECCFDYRNSIFKNKNYVILGSTFKFEQIDIEESTKRRFERLKLVKNKQDRSKYNFGTVFMQGDPRIMLLMKRIHPGYKNGVAFSRKTSNWLINYGEGTYEQAIKLIRRVQLLHKILGKKAIPEVIIWE